MPEYGIELFRNNVIIFGALLFFQPPSMIPMCIRFTTSLSRTQRDITSTPTLKNISQVTETVSISFCFSQTFFLRISRFKMMAPIVDFPGKDAIPNKMKREYCTTLYSFVCDSKLNSSECGKIFVQLLERAEETCSSN